jgi:hypothetical protein
MKTLAWSALLLVFPAALRADLPIRITVDPGAGTVPISPYIYGTNQDLPGVATPGSRRIGGDRLTGYNWETNASNAGNDYIDNSDNFMVSGLPASQQGIPAIALTNFHDQSLAEGTPYTVVTLQMAGYVAADENGPVTAAQAAPSSRWNQVVNDKPGGVYLNPPNLTDGVVYMDELLNVLITKYGPASGKTGIRGYNLDNEPSLWPSTHPYLHPAQTTCAEETTKSAALAKTIKRMDPSAEVLGAVLYGSEAYMTFQNAPDWPAVQAKTGYRWFIDDYLDQMNQASASAGMRLLDVLDLHRYSDENIGGPAAGTSITAQTDFTDTATDKDRVQAPRVLWDTTYVENSWVQEYYPQFLPWIPNLQASISARYPGTKLSFTEYCYGGESDISGGLAQADVLGIYGKYGVYLGCFWLLHGSPSPLYAAAAFNLYLNYDGQGGRFGSASVSESDSDTVNSSAYASLDSTGALHVVVLNKSYTEAADVTFQIAGQTTYTAASVYAFNASSPSIAALASASIANNRLTYTLPALTAAHFVFRTSMSPSPPAFMVEPISQTLQSGSTVVFNAGAAGVGAAGYQWFLNGSALTDGGGVSGSETSTLMITGATAANAGSYTCTAGNAWGIATSSAALLTVVSAPNPGHLINVSCRAQVGTGASQLIAGFVVGGASAGPGEPVLIRASGPALLAFGVAGILPDPSLVLNNPSGVMASDSGWNGSAQVTSTAAQVGAFAWTSSSSKDSALVETLPPAAYTAEITGTSGDTGIALAEVYDATPAASYSPSAPHLVNISARLQVGTGANILIAGFVVGGTTSKTVLLRASGPALASFGVSGTLSDPQLSLYRSNADGTSTLLSSNTGWGGNAQIAAAAGSVGAFSWGSQGTPDSAILVTLPPGAYTAQVQGASGDTGIALVEAYDVP